MKVRFLYLSFLVTCQIVAMDGGSADLDQQMIDIIRGNRDVSQFETLCKQRPQPLSALTRRNGARKPADPVMAELKDALETEEANLKAAEDNLTWCGNTGRRNQVVGGLLAIGVGVAQVGYNLFAFTDEDADKGAAGFGTAGGGTLALGGAYAVKIAIENGGAKIQYATAKSAIAQLRTMVLALKFMSQQQGSAGGSSSASSSLVETAGFTSDDGDGGESFGSSASTSSYSGSGGSSGATSHGGGSSSFLSTDGD